MRDAWHENIDIYLRNRNSLVGVVLVMDIRHPLKEFDQMMLEWAFETSLPLHIILTKCDKLKRGAQNAVLFNVRDQLPDTMSVQLYSSTHDIGRDELIRTLVGWLVDHSSP
jgi:GTP-binding protein